jgi:hypothetical protein
MLEQRRRYIGADWYRNFELLEKEMRRVNFIPQTQTQKTTVTVINTHHVTHLRDLPQANRREVPPNQTGGWKTGINE